MSDSTIENSLIDGLVLHRYVTNSTLSSVDSHDNGVDGIKMTRASTGIVLSQVTANRNGRNGITLNGGALADLLCEVVGEAAGELEDGGFGDVGRGERGIAAPADLDAREQVRLGPGEPVQPPRPERRARAENLDVRHEAELGPAPVGDSAHLLELGHRLAADKPLPEQLLVARDLDHRVG